MRDEPPAIIPGRVATPVKERAEDLGVEIIANITDRTKLMELLTGWEQVMSTPNSLQWLRIQLWGYLAS
jgi:3-deoxy-D-manno-octulosonate 8-phosphate phosphatase KdsC-like HAD superfamily phosphatase